MNMRIANKINKNPGRYHGHQIVKAETLAGRSDRRAAKKKAKAAAANEDS